MPDIDLKKLAEPFKADEIEWRIGRSGAKQDGTIWAVALAYVTNRAIQERLDAVVGPENWQDQYVTIEGGFLCAIGVRCGAEWVWKWDGADQTDIEAIKGGLSGAEKRAAVKWGIGRYLYDLTETFVETSTERKQGWHRAETKDKKVYYWQAPTLPAWALPKANSSPPRATPPAAPPKATEPAPPQPCKEYQMLRNFLKNCGCTTTEQANAVINWAVPDVGEIGALQMMAGECRQIFNALEGCGMTGPQILAEATQVAA